MPTLTIPSVNAAAPMRDAVDETWAAIRAGVGTNLFVSAGNYLGYAEKGATTNQWGQLMRLVAPFDTSGIGPNQIIQSATVTFTGFTKANHGGVNLPPVNLYFATPLVAGQVSQGDYERISTTPLSTAIGFNAWNVGSANVFTLNGAGLNAINPLGWTTIAARFVWDADGTVPGDWNAFNVGAWTGDPTMRPILSVTYAEAPAGPPTAVLHAAATAIGDRWDVTAIVEGDAP